MKRIVLAGLLGLIGAGCARPYHEAFHLRDLEVVYTDRVSEVCGGAPACYLIEQNMIVVKRGDRCAAGHELCHATYGDYNHQGPCAR